MFQTFQKRAISSVLVFSVMIMSVVTGCASGGFKLTREYARFVNRQPIILRIILYILTIVVFAVTVLIDMVINNTMDFWDGRVSQGTYNFEKDGRKYAVQHILHDDTGLRESRILVSSHDANEDQRIVLRETAEREIELYINGALKARVSNISSLPLLSLFDEKGGIVEKLPLRLDEKDMFKLAKAR